MKYRVQECGTGRGVFACEAILAKSVIMLYSGPMLRYEQTSPTTLALQIGPDLYMGESKAADDFVNHCCEPNAGMLIDGCDVQLVAIRDIATGEQITFDYSTTMDEDDFEFDCLCGKEKCRGRIRDFKHLPAAIGEYYGNLGVVPLYNRKYL
jgi:SET domain-containing protein